MTTNILPKQSGGSCRHEFFYQYLSRGFIDGCGLSLVSSGQTLQTIFEPRSLGYLRDDKDLVPTSQFNFLLSGAD